MLERTRVMGIGILLARLKAVEADPGAAVLSMEPRALFCDVLTVSAMLHCVPRDDEAAVLHSFVVGSGGDVADLSDAERFAWKLLQVCPCNTTMLLYCTMSDARCQTCGSGCPPCSWCWRHPCRCWT